MTLKICHEKLDSFCIKHNLLMDKIIFIKFRLEKIMETKENFTKIKNMLEENSNKLPITERMVRLKIYMTQDKREILERKLNYLEYAQKETLTKLANIKQIQLKHPKQCNVYKEMMKLLNE